MRLERSIDRTRCENTKGRAPSSMGLSPSLFVGEETGQLDHGIELDLSVFGQSPAIIASGRARTRLWNSIQRILRALRQSRLRRWLLCYPREASPRVVSVFGPSLTT
jgi:hypothetical protein